MVTVLWLALVGDGVEGYDRLIDCVWDLVVAGWGWIEELCAVADMCTSVFGDE